MTTSQKKTMQQALEQAQQAIAELETKLAFQEYTVDALNDALADQQMQIEKLEFQLKHVIDKVKGMEPSTIAKISDEMPPPHY